VTQEFWGEKLSNQTHAWISELDARLYKKAVSFQRRLQ